MQSLPSGKRANDTPDQSKVQLHQTANVEDKAEPNTSLEDLVWHRDGQDEEVEEVDGDEYGAASNVLVDGVPERQ